jgi:hypothetical protein
VKNAYETVIIGAGISGLACAKNLKNNDKDFVVISENIGGRILTSDDGKTNYGAFFVCSDYHNFLKYVTIKSRIKLSDFCFHDKEKNYVLYDLTLLSYLFQFFKVKNLLYKFRRALRNLRIISEEISQKKAIENDSFLYDLYMQNAADFVKKNNLHSGTKKYLSQALYSTTFSQINEMNAFSFLQFLLPLITPIYTFNFEKDKMIESFKEKIIIGSVKNITYKSGLHNIEFDGKIVHAKNVVLATNINWSKKYANIQETNKPVSTNMLHIKGDLVSQYTKKLYHLFTPPNNVQSIANLKDGTYLFYYKNKQPNLNDFFQDYNIIAHHFWDPAGTINGHNLIDSKRKNNLFLIGDYNIAGLEESFITGIHAANKIINP